MRIIDRYIGKSVLAAFVLTLVTLTFVMSLGGLFRVTDLLARGVPAGLILSVFLWGIPSILVFALPISVLTASLLVFGRVSHDGEITAMKACGIQMAAIIRLPLIGAAVLTGVCVYINASLAPLGHFRQRQIVGAIGADVALSLLEEGRFIRDFPGLAVYIGRLEGDQVEDVVIYDTTLKRGSREIRARRGTLAFSADQRILMIDLQDVRIDPFYEDRPGAGYADRWPVRLPMAEARRRGVEKRIADFSMAELAGMIKHLGMAMEESARAAGRGEVLPLFAKRDLNVDRMPYVVELHKRLAISLACVAFAYLGMPLGIKAHRKESSLSIGMSLGVAILFYLFFIVAGSLDRRPELRPYLFVWLPVLASFILGTYLVRRAN